MWTDDATEGIPWVAIGDMSGTRLVAGTNKLVSLSGASSKGLPVGQAGTVLFAMYASVGAVSALGVKATWNQALLGLEASDLADQRFLAYWLEHYAPQAVAQARSATQANLNADQVANFPFPDLSLEEQRRIAAFLDDRVDRIDRIIAARRQQIQHVKECLQAERRHEVLGLRDGQVATPLPWATHVGAGRPLRRLFQVTRIGTGHTPSRSVPEYWENCTIPWLTTADVHKFRYDQIDVIDQTELQISELGLANSAAVLHPANTVALSRTASAGFPVILGKDMATSQDYFTWTCGPEIIPAYLLETLRVMRSYLLKYLATGSTHKTIYFPDLQDLEVPLPSLGAQQAAVERVRHASSVALSAEKLLTNQIARLSEYKSSLITAAATGELDVTTASRRIPGE